LSTNSAPPVETVPISRLYCSPTNPRHNDAAVPHVAASIRRFGWQQPIVARRTGEVIAGNTRLKAAQSLGMTEVPVWWFEGSDLDAIAYGIADNRSATFAEFDEPVLAKLLEQLRAEDSLDGVGYSTDDIDALGPAPHRGGPRAPRRRCRRAAGRCSCEARRPLVPRRAPAALRRFDEAH
jgi:hypothetical protein